MRVEELWVPILTDWSICEKVFYSGTSGGGEVQGSQLAHEEVRDDGIKG